MKKRLTSLLLAAALMCALVLPACALESEDECEHDYQLTTYDLDTHTLTCSKCQEKLTEAHTWGDGTVINDATTQEDGLKMYVCSGGCCIRLETIPKLEGEAPVPQTYPIESRYAANGPYTVNTVAYESGEERYTEYKIWYPTELEKPRDWSKYPVVVFANGTGVTYDTDPNYIQVFSHLASWGFICVGNNDGESWRGDSTSKALDFLLDLNNDPSSVFFQKVNTRKIGVSGHSQGGVGALNAVSNFENSDMFRSVFAASTTSHDLAAGLEWSYDPEKVHVPCFLVAGTGLFDSAMIAPLESVVQNYDSLEAAAMGRRKNADHGEMLTIADGYMTAWFCYTLMNDEDASAAFCGENAELLQNENWQDTAVKNLTCKKQDEQMGTLIPWLLSVDLEPANTFRDVPARAYYAEAVRWAAAEGITEGTSTGEFQPDGICTRAQIVTFLWRANGSPKPSTSENPFTDVRKSDWYYEAVLWALENGITEGTGEHTFSPNAFCTRGQIVTFLYRSQGTPDNHGNAIKFVDVNADDYFYSAVCWAVEKEITTGISSTYFAPDMACTRAQAVTFLYRAFQS